MSVRAGISKDRDDVMSLFSVHCWERATLCLCVRRVLWGRFWNYLICGFQASEGQLCYGDKNLNKWMSISKTQIEDKILFINNHFLCPRVHSWSYNYMLWSICVPYIDLPGIFTVGHEQWSARRTLCAWEEDWSCVGSETIHTLFLLWTCKMSAAFWVHSQWLSGKVCCYFCPTSCPKCELHRVLQSHQLFTPDTFTASGQQILTYWEMSGR